METTTISITSIIILILQGGITLIVSVIGWWIKGISSELREMNGNVRDLKAWKEVHQPQEESWHRENRQDHKELWEEIKSIREVK